MNKNFAEQNTEANLLAELQKVPQKLNNRIHIFKNHNLCAAIKALPYKGYWYLMTCTPKGVRKDLLSLYANVFSELPKVKSIDYALLVREVSDAGVVHLHGFLHTKTKTQLLKLKKSINLVWMVRDMYPFYDYDYWYEYILKTAPSSYMTYSKHLFLTRQFRTWDGVLT